MAVGKLSMLSFMMLYGVVAAEFWVTATIEELRFNPDCIENSRCEIGESSFKLSHQLLTLNQSKSNHFPIATLTERLTLVSHWEFGNPEDLETELAIVKSLKSKPAMILSCDDSQEIFLVEKRVQEKTVYSKQTFKGRCFNATITLQVHSSHVCPWCDDPSYPVALTSPSSAYLVFTTKLQDPFVFWPMVVAGILLLVVIFLLFSLIFYSCSSSDKAYSVSSTPTTSKSPLISHSPESSNPSYVNTHAFLKNHEKLPYFIRPQYLYSDQRYDKVAYLQRTPPQSRRAFQPDTPESIIRTPSPSIIGGMV